MTEEQWLACDDAVEMMLPRRHYADDPRKLALFAVAGGLLIWDFLDGASRALISAAERDAEWSGEDLHPHVEFELRLRSEEVWVLCLRSLQGRGRDARAANIVRDIFGNPFRSVSFDPAWRTSTVVALAQQMYDSRDFSAMPILGDALQDAGCDHADILDHCRSAGSHVRGCWVVDLVLGKE